MICQKCGKLFLTHISRLEIGKGKYCSRECQYAAAKTRITKKCKQCQKPFSVFLADHKRGKGIYCSPKCQRESQKTSVEVDCQYCGKKFMTIPYNLKNGTGKYCSRECHHKSKENKIKTICQNCKKEMEVWPAFYKENRNFCSRNCYFQYNRGENSYSWQGGKSFEPYCHKFNNELKETIREKWDRICPLCNKPETENGGKLGVHHIDYNKEQGCTGDFFLIPLCKSCHGKTNHNRDYWQEYLTCLFTLKELKEIEIMDVCMNE